jgi:SAM-dependent methyltransferase
MLSFFQVRARRHRLEPDAPVNEAERLLDSLLDRDEIIDRFDANYIDDLPDLLRELHGVTDENLAGHELRPTLERLCEEAGRQSSEISIAELRDAVRPLVREGRYTPLENTPKEKRKYKMTTVASWADAAGARVRGRRDREVVNTLQREYSIQQGGADEVEFKHLARPETGDPWTPLIIDLRERRIVGADEPVLTIGPRWVGEIVYFREELGLRRTIGLDLFSHDEQLVRVGDMHAMPFDADTFGLVYQRNTFDKSYDIRRVLHECVRVLRDGGVLITDDCYEYTEGVSETARTNIKHNRQVLRVLGDHVADVLYDREERAEADWIARVGQLAVRIRK